MAKLPELEAASHLDQTGVITRGGLGSRREMKGIFPFDRQQTRVKSETPLSLPPHLLSRALLIQLLKILLKAALLPYIWRAWATQSVPA